jgi:hypothetical protein
MSRASLRRTGGLLELVGAIVLFVVLAALIGPLALASLGVIISQWLVIVVSLLAIVTALF